MNHYDLHTQLPPLPAVPGPPPLPLEPLWARCREVLDEPAVAALEAVRALDEVDLEPTPDPVARMRGRMARAMQRAQEAGSELLLAWCRYDTALREALAAQRAGSTGRDWPKPDPEVEDRAAALGPMAAGLMSIADPLARQRALDTARLRELSRLMEDDEFGTEAVLGRVVAALVVDRWDRWPAMEAMAQMEAMEEMAEVCR